MHTYLLLFIPMLLLALLSERGRSYNHFWRVARSVRAGLKSIAVGVLVAVILQQIVSEAWEQLLYLIVFMSLIQIQIALSLQRAVWLYGQSLVVGLLALYMYLNP